MDRRTRESDLKTRTMAMASAIGSVVVLGGVAHAQVSVEISPEAGYEQSLKCYRYYDVAEQVAGAFSERAKGGSDEQKEYRKQGAAAKLMKTVWNKQIDAAKGDRSNKAVDEDLETFGAPVIADANAGLAGDEEASARYEAVQAACKPFEVATE